jgi:PST family polysaccharide transporter
VVVGGVAAIAAALAGFGPWAVVANLVESTLEATVHVWILLDWRPQASFSRESARDLGGFSGRVFSASVLAWGDQNIDKALVGRYVGANPLGSYSLAYAAMLLPLTTLGRSFNQVLSPAFSRIQADRRRLEQAWLRSKRVSVAVVAPAMLALVVLAPDFVPVVFGDQWKDAVVPLQLLCIGGVAASLVNLHWAVLLAGGQGSTLLRLTFWSSLARWAAILIGLPWGIVGVAASYAAVRWLLVVPSTWFTTQGVSFGFWPALRAGVGTLPAAIAAAAAGAGARQLLLETAAPPAARLIVASGVIFLVYLTIVLATTPSVVREALRIVRSAPA